MDHVAILRKSKLKKGDNLLGQILKGEKTIESRWYVNKIAPWGQINKGDFVYLKESGCPVTAKAAVKDVLQFDLLDDAALKKIVITYGKDIAPDSTPEKFLNWLHSKSKIRYCILVFLADVQKLTPFNIDKKGFGCSAAWLVVKDINKVKLT